MTRKLKFAGYTFTAGPDGTVVDREYAQTGPGDYGCDPLPDGRYRMVPSGDVVDATEKERRLRK